MNLNRIARLQRNVIAPQQDFGVNGNSLAPACQHDLPRVALIVAPGCDDGLGERQSLGPGDFRISHVADDADDQALRVAQLSQGLLLSRGECGLGLRPGFRAGMGAAGPEFRGWRRVL